MWFAARALALTKRADCPATVQRHASSINGAAEIREDAQASNACQINWLTQRHEAVLTLQSCDDRPRVGPLRARYAEEVRSRSRKPNHRERPGSARAGDEQRQNRGLFKRRILDRGTAVTALTDRNKNWRSAPQNRHTWNSRIDGYTDLHSRWFVFWDARNLRVP